MAKFKLNMLTSKVSSNTKYVSYIETPISEFYSQSDVYDNKLQGNFDSQLNSYCYTFNEKISFHLNGQKELQFSMLKNIWIDNELTTNPFISILKNGSQVLLIDQYDNEYFFTIKNITYMLGESNITYNYSCQDSFTYQHIRQNNGYTITNDSSSDSFIGAYNIDWWVVNKIRPECHISYQYVPLQMGIYMDYNKNIHLFNSNTTGVYKVIKPIYDQEQYAEYYERIPFSVSGSNASAALIEIAEELGLMVNFCECNVKNPNRSSNFVRYFWFEPKRNEKTANLKYSPDTTIQSFNFSQGGAALSTILNVEGRKSDDDAMITLIPEIPAFFSSLFSSPSWETTSFNAGFFSTICKEKVFMSDEGNGDFNYDLSADDVREENPYIYIPIYNTIKENNGVVSKVFKIPYFYDKISFKCDTKTSYITLDEKYNSVRNTKWDFIVRYKEKDGTSKDVIYNETYSLIPSELWGTEQTCFIRIYWPTEKEILYGTSSFVLRFYRDVTTEELEFAEIADKCPWLENKLIDFSYFYKNKILSQLEYESLLNTLQNNLRIVNGQLLYFSKDYYTAIHSKTTALAELTSTLDSLGAAFASDIVSSYKENGVVKNIDYFNKAYDTVISKYYKITEKTLIVNYDELLTEYWNKYFNAQQRFLKNIYHFKKFFNQPKTWGEDGAAIYNIALSLSDKIDWKELDKVQNKSYTEHTVRFWSFNKNVSFNTVDINFTLYDDNLTPFVKIYESDKKTQSIIVDKNNVTSFHKNLIDKDSIIACDANEGFSPMNTYFKVAYVALLDDCDSTPDVIIDQDKNKWYRYKKDETQVWYSSALPEVSWFKNGVDTRKQTITCKLKEKNTTFNKTFVEVIRREIINEYIYRCFKDGSPSWFHHDTNTQTSTSVWWDNTKIDEKLSIFHPTVFGNTFTQAEWNNNSFGQLITSIKNFLNGVDHNEESDTKVNFYKSHFPVKQVSFKGTRYSKIPYTVMNGSTEVSFTYQPINKKGQTLTEYLSYLKDKTLPVVKNPFSESEKDTYTIPMVNADNEPQYFRRVPKLGVAITAGLILSPDVLFGIGSFWIRKALFTSNTKWENGGLNTANFVDESYDDMQYTGYHDHSEIVYARTARSYEEYLELHSERGADNYYDINNVDSKGKIIWNTEEPYDYYDFYSKIGLTYSSARSNKNFLFTDGYLRPLQQNDPINPKYKYRVLCLNNSDEEDLIFTDGHSIKNCGEASNNYQISKILYYFLYNNTTEFDVQGVVEGTKLSTLLGGKKEDWEDYVYTNSDTSIKMIFFQDEDFKRSRVVLNSYWDEDTSNPSNNVLKFSHRFSLYSPTKPVHDYEQGIIVNFIDEKYPDIVAGFYKQALEDTFFVPITNSTTIVWDENEEGSALTKFFYQKNGEWVRAYTINQAKTMPNKFYYIHNNNYKNEVVGQKVKFDIPIYLHTETYTKEFLDEDKEFYNWKLKSSFIQSQTESFIFPNFYSESKTKEFIFKDSEGNEYVQTCEAKKISEITLDNLTNGEFWYQFHTRSDNPILFEEAAVIESQLTQYWQQAYSASLYCEYFLPEHWQTRGSGDVNYFSDNIIRIDENKKVSLSNKYIPDVAIYTTETSLFPKYELRRIGNYDSSYTLDTISGDINKLSYTSASKILGNNPSFKQAFDELGEDMGSFEILNDLNLQNTIKTNYYYVENNTTGTKWKNMLQSHSTIPTKYEKYSGLYVMTYDILKSNFNKRTIERYSELKNQQQLIWQQLYEKFPGVLLESSFTNDYAATSLELYKLASIAFKDKMNVENNYSISLINAYKSLSVKNNSTSFLSYTGQELRIGESILVDADEYYDKRDDVYNAMSQYLFITDITYDLRKDSDISLTVNAIKYQDKLIQRLVKLIK